MTTIIVEKQGHDSLASIADAVLARSVDKVVILGPVGQSLSDGSLLFHIATQDPAEGLYIVGCDGDEKVQFGLSLYIQARNGTTIVCSSQVEAARLCHFYWPGNATASLLAGVKKEIAERGH